MRIVLIPNTDPSNLSPEDYLAIDRLLAQLSTRKRPPTNSRDLAHALNEGMKLYVCRNDDGSIIGMASIVFVHTVSGSKGLVEDVVVDDAHQRKGIARALMQKLIFEAQMQSLRYVDLTSGPDRVAANTLYLSLGFVRRETNVFRLKS